MQNTKTLMITSAHPHGFAFAWVKDNDGDEQCFIPVHVAAEANLNLSAGDVVQAVLAPNFSDKSRDGTKWQALKLVSDAPAIDPDPSPVEVNPTELDAVTAREELDAHVLEFVSACAYATTSEIASACRVDQRTAGNAAQRHYNGGRICRAEVYHRTGQSRPSFILYASDAQNFLEEDQ
tara:strand:+ start:441 stop:977 length:537 start_codon:yes stop_codon:yes gene_type:complete